MFRSIWTRLGSARAWAAVVLLAGASVLCLPGVRGLTSSARGGQTDEVSAYARRFTHIKKVLPPRGLVCYLPDPESSPEANKNYFLARYALAPLMVRTVPDCEPLIGNFGSSSEVPASVGDEFVVQRDFGNGLLLVKRKRQR
jgi:hypothetical protein